MKAFPSTQRHGAAARRTRMPKRELKTRFGGLTRSQLMSRIRSSGNRSTELAMIRLLRSSGLAGWRRRYPLFGRPDFVWPRCRVGLFVDGCFWHGHQRCSRNLRIGSNVAFWHDKIKRNRKRDALCSARLSSGGWTIVRVWECHLRKRPASVVRRIASCRVQLADSARPTL